MGDFDGQVAVISGGTGDIGLAIARTFLARGARVALCDLKDHAAGTEMASALGPADRVDYRRIDVTDADAVTKWVEHVEDQWGTPTLVVPNAATVTVSPPDEFVAEKWEREIAVNLHGAFYLAKAAGRRMIEGKMNGRIVFVGSWAGHAPHPKMSAYCVAKAGMRMLCRCLAIEWAKHGILVNEVAPGYVDAGLSGRFFQEEEGRRERARDWVPIGQLIKPADVAAQVVHLCENENRHITGQTIVMDGGLSLISPGT